MPDVVCGDDECESPSCNPPEYAMVFAMPEPPNEEARQMAFSVMEAVLTDHFKVDVRRFGTLDEILADDECQPTVTLPAEHLDIVTTAVWRSLLAAKVNATEPPSRGVDRERARVEAEQLKGVLTLLESMR